MKPKDFRNNKGSITLYVLVALIFFVIVIFSAFALSQSRLEGQEYEYEKIKKEYEKPDENLSDKYNELTSNTL